MKLVTLKNVSILTGLERPVQRLPVGCKPIAVIMFQSSPALKDRCNGRVLSTGHGGPGFNPHRP